MNSNKRNEEKVVLEAQDSKLMQYGLPPVIPKGIFRTYDIRGEANESGVSPGIAYAIGLVFGSMVQQKGGGEVIVGRDGRLTGFELTQALVVGLRQSGCDVIDIGQVPTPLVYFATKTLSANSGIMVTASHNPGHHNGFKSVLDGVTLSTEGVQTLYQRITEHNWTVVSQQGGYREHEIIEPYIRYVSEHVQLQRPLKVVVDCGNGIAGVVAPALYRAMGCEVIELFCEVDGHFPNHHPDPTIPENLDDIRAAVKAHQADVGLAFDGDGDRLGLITNEGEIIWPDRQLLFFAQDVLKQHPGSKIVFDVKCTNHLSQKITEWGGLPIMNQTGHSLIKKRMIAESAPFAGEMSGHIFFNDEWFGFDDGAYVGARALRIVASQSSTISELFQALPDSINTPELKLPMAEEKKSAFMHALIKGGDFGEAKRITIDGLRVDFGYGWGLVRPSNTSAYLVIRFEAETQDQLNTIQACFRDALLSIDSELELPF